MGFTDYSDVLLVSSAPHPSLALSDCLYSRYFSLFATYTPYTIYKCKQAQECNGRRLTSRYQTAGQGGER